MLVMLCTRCQQREVQHIDGATPEQRARMHAKFEAEVGVPWTFPEDLCKECRIEWFKSPEGKAQLEPFRRAMDERLKKEIERWKNGARAAALKVLDVADALAGKL